MHPIDKKMHVGDGEKLARPFLSMRETNPLSGGPVLSTAQPGLKIKL